MARTVRDNKTDTRSARTKLAQRSEPYWTAIAAGCSLGYRRGLKTGTWIGRFRDDTGNQHYQALGAADDARDADNLSVFSFAEAQAKARDFFARKAREVVGDFVSTGRPCTVAEAMEAYKSKYVRRGGNDVGRIESATRTYIGLELGQIPVAKLTKLRLEQWHHAIATTPARVRPKKGEGPRVGKPASTAEGHRRRAATANRVLGILKAALNNAYQHGRVAADDAWRRLKPFRKVDAARIRYLSDDEARRLVKACDPEFRPMVVAALMTGCRYSELAALVVEDFHRDPGVVTVRTSKSGKPRHVALSPEGRDFFCQQSSDKAAVDRIFAKVDGSRWSTSDQQRRMASACTLAEVDRITFHGLRHTYASRLAMKNVPLAVIAAQLGHADTRMVEKHYGHLAPNYVADTVRAAFTNMGLMPANDVVAPGKIQATS